jgi:hypothetical protein
MEEVPELYTIVWGITAHHLVKGDIRRHLDLSYRLLQIAETSNDSSRWSPPIPRERSACISPAGSAMHADT